jgi:L-2-hydroxyglutarate oxidase LhgO
MMKNVVDITIIGAGLIGLALAAKIANRNKQIYVLERHTTFGQEISSRHSSIIHAGIYYPEESFKAKFCVTGNRLLYQICQENGISCRKLGKLIVATNEKEAEELTILLEKGKKNCVTGLKLLSRWELKKLEPNIEGVAAILSPETGIIDSHTLMKYFITKAKKEGVQIIYKTEVINIERVTGGYQVEVSDSDGRFSFTTKILINCAGLNSDRVAEQVGIDLEDASYRLYYCKGEYFSVIHDKRKLINRLIFPVPPVGIAGVGIHVVLDLDGRMRLGPSIRYTEKIDYAITDENKKLFYNSVRNFLPFLDYEDLQPEMVGIRPKLQGPGMDIRDFVIRDEKDKGLPGFINLIGIESPGLTSAPGIAEYVDSLVNEALSSLE